MELPWHLPRTSADFRGERRVAVAMAADGHGNERGWPWKLPRQFRKTAVAIAVDGLPWLLRRSLPRVEPRHMPWPQPWPLPWKCHELWHVPWNPANFHSSPWKHPRKSTEVPQSLPRTSAKNSNNVCIRGKWWLCKYLTHKVSKTHRSFCLRRISLL